MTERNLFEIAARKKYRFPSAKGELMVEQLFDLSLTNLDQSARTINNELKSITEESFIDTRPNPRAAALKDMLEIVKFAIADRQERALKDAQKADRAREKAAIREALAVKAGQALSTASAEDLQKRLAELDAQED